MNDLPKIEVLLKFSSSPEINKKKDIRNPSIQYMEGTYLYTPTSHSCFLQTISEFS